MKVTRLIGGLSAALVLAASVPSLAAGSPGVRGGGFLRSTDKTKVTLAISGSDAGVLGDSGQAQVVSHTPGGPADAVHVTLMCVHVVGSVALSSGFGSDGKIYLIVVKDNGQGQEADEFAVIEELAAHNYCLAGLVPTNGALGTAEGGNFQVFSS